jgi:hypothetical protein
MDVNGPISGKTLKDLIYRPNKKFNDDIINSSMSRLFEFPDGVMVTIKINKDAKSIEILEKPRKGLSAERLEKMQKILLTNPYVGGLIKFIPVKEYYASLLFYGPSFSKEIEYSSDSFLFVAFEIDGKVCDRRVYLNTLETIGALQHELPLLFEGRPEFSKFNVIKNVSKLSINSFGDEGLLICEPLYHPISNELMMFIISSRKAHKVENSDDISEADIKSIMGTDNDEG